jgi:CRP-like cAMP-binding protein
LGGIIVLSFFSHHRAIRSKLGYGPRLRLGPYPRLSATIAAAESSAGYPIQKNTTFAITCLMQHLEPNVIKKVPKGTILLRAGEKSNVLFRVLKGCLKSYVVDKAGKEHIVYFAPEEWLISDMDSILNGGPSRVTIEAIEDSEVGFVHQISFDYIQNVAQPDLVEMNLKLLKHIIAINKRLIGLLSNTAEERYVQFTETYPTLVQRLPLKLIASFIGITPEYLSEIRRKIAKPASR